MWNNVERDRTRQEQGPKATRYCSELSFRMSKIWVDSATVTEFQLPHKSIYWISNDFLLRQYGLFKSSSSRRLSCRRRGAFLHTHNKQFCRLSPKTKEVMRSVKQVLNLVRSRVPRSGLKGQHLPGFLYSRGQKCRHKGGRWFLK